MGLNRRNFLQRAGFALFALGAGDRLGTLWGSQCLAAPLADNYLQALTQPNARKLALLVGIDRYPHSKNLSGCTTDVELQRELLVHRFGFHPRDVMVLSNQQATREDIETAFIEHLIEQAGEGDIVVFHFSGYGSLVKTPLLDPEVQPELPPYSFQKSLLPTDGVIPTKNQPAGNDLLLDTLILLAQALPTNQVTLVLDTSFQGTGEMLYGNLRSRSSSLPPANLPNPQELGFQDQLRSRFKLAQKPLGKPAKSLTIPGLVLLAAQNDRIATERQWRGFSAGLFTYTLTQSLWEVTPASTIYVALTRTVQKMAAIAPQRPQLLVGNKLKSPLLAYSALPVRPGGAEGTIVNIEDNSTTAKLQLAGLPSQVLKYYQPNSRLLLLLEAAPLETSNRPGTTALLQLHSREGLTAKAKLLKGSLPEGKQLQIGQLVQEQIRVLPRNIGLTVALDANLTRIERVDATSAFSNISTVASAIAAGEQDADCLFAHRELIPQDPSTNDAPPTSYELFSVGRVPIPNTSGQEEEAIKSGVERLTPHLRTLLAAKLWRLTLNEGSSRLGLQASLDILEPIPKTLIKYSTLRSGRIPVENKQPLLSLPEEQRDRSPGEGFIPTAAAHSPIQYSIKNYSDRPIYGMFLGLDSDGSAIALYSAELDAVTNKVSSNTPCIEPGSTLTLPQTASDWNISSTPGLVELHLICSVAPFTQVLRTLAAANHSQSAGERWVKLKDPLDVARALLQDLHAASGVNPDWIGSEVYAFDVEAWVTLSFVYRVV